MPRYRIGDYTFTLRVTGARRDLAREVADGLQAVLHGFRTARTTPPVARAPFDMTTPVGNLRGYDEADGHVLEVALAPDAPHDRLLLVDMIEPEIVNLAVRESTGNVWIHGACLARGRERILLVAASGTGKTTLSLGLVARGYKLITDDIILIDPITCTVKPLPRCPKIRPTAADFLRAAGFDLRREVRLLGRYVLLDPRQLHRAPLPLPISRTYMLERDAMQPGRMDEIDPVSGVLALLPRSNLLGIDPTLELANRLFATTRFYDVNLSSFGDDLDAIARPALPRQRTTRSHINS